MGNALAFTNPRNVGAESQSRREPKVPENGISGNFNLSAPEVAENVTLQEYRT
jgi:hypothetical protein